MNKMSTLIEANRLLNIAVNDKELAAELIASGGEHLSHWAIGDDFRACVLALDGVQQQTKVA